MKKKTENRKQALPDFPICISRHTGDKTHRETRRISGNYVSSVARRLRIYCIYKLHTMYILYT